MEQNTNEVYRENAMFDLLKSIINLAAFQNSISKLSFNHNYVLKLEAYRGDACNKFSKALLIGRFGARYLATQFYTSVKYFRNSIKMNNCN